MIYPYAGGVNNISEAHFVTDIDTDFPEPDDGNMFLILVMAVDGQENVGDQSGQHLHHQPILAP